MGKQIPQNSVISRHIGLRAGFYVTKVEKRTRPADIRKSSNRVRAIRKLIQNISGLSPYEKRAIELYKVGEAKLDKRANRFLRRRLGAYSRAQHKEEYLRAVIKSQKDAVKAAAKAN